MHEIIIVLVIWVGLGIATIKNEFEAETKRIMNLSFFQVLTLIPKAFFYGPFTGRKVIAKL